MATFCVVCQTETSGAPDTCDHPGRMFCEVCGTYFDELDDKATVEDFDVIFEEGDR